MTIETAGAACMGVANICYCACPYSYKGLGIALIKEFCTAQPNDSCSDNSIDKACRRVVLSLANK